MSSLHQDLIDYFERGAPQDGSGKALIESLPYLKFLGIETNPQADGTVLTTLPFQDHLVGNAQLPAIHGGVIGSFLEITAIVQLIWIGQAQFMPRTVNITVDYMRSGRAEPLYGRAIVSKLGRRLSNVRVECWQSDPDKLTAVGIGNFLTMQQAG